MAATPYPNSIGVFENPCIYYGDADGSGNPPRIFTAISGTASGAYTVLNNPVVKVPNNTTINSDPDLFYDAVNNKLCLISRENTNGYAVYYQESLNGQSWTPRTANYLWKKGVGGSANQPEMISPAVLKIGIKWRIACVTGNCGYLVDETYLKYQNQLSKGIRIMEGTSFIGNGDFVEVGKLSLLGKGAIHPWHFDMSIDPTTGKYYMVVVGINYDTLVGSCLYLAESIDGLDFKIFSKPLCVAKSFYRPTFFIKANGDFILYWSTESGASTTAADYPNGSLDIPIDGRAIGYSKAKLTDIIADLALKKVKGWG